MKKIMTIMVVVMTMVSIMVPVMAHAKSYCEYDYALEFYKELFEDNAICYSGSDLSKLAEIMADDYDNDVVGAIKYTDTTYGWYQHQMTMLFGSVDEDNVFTYRTVIVAWSDTMYGRTGVLISVDDTNRTVNMTMIAKAYEIVYAE